MTLQEAPTGYMHATAPGWATAASKEDLAATWVAAAPWRDRDPAAAHVAETVEERITRDWPDLAAAYNHGRDQGLGPLDAMGRAVNERLPGDRALHQAGRHEERLAEQHLSLQDDPLTPRVNEELEGVASFVQDTKRALDLQAQGRPAGEATATRVPPTMTRPFRR